MWVKRTEEEIAAAQARVNRSRRYEAVAVGIVVAVLLTVLRDKSWILGHTSPFVPLEEMPPRIPFSIISGFFGGWLFYHFRPHQKTVVCPKCEKVKVEESVPECTCGGHFENIETMKWVR